MAILFENILLGRVYGELSPCQLLGGKLDWVIFEVIEEIVKYLKKKSGFFEMTGKKNSLGSETMLLIDKIVVGLAELVWDLILWGNHQTSLSGI